jgi:hypothetical protein
MMARNWCAIATASFTVIACDKREAFAQGSVSDDCVRRSSKSEGGQVASQNGSMTPSGASGEFLIPARSGVEQRLGVFVLGRGKNVCRGALLDNHPALHDRDPVTDLGGHA